MKYVVIQNPTLLADVEHAIWVMSPDGQSLEPQQDLLLAPGTIIGVSAEKKVQEFVDSHLEIKLPELVEFNGFDSQGLEDRARNGRTVEDPEGEVEGADQRGIGSPRQAQSIVDSDQFVEHAAEFENIADFGYTSRGIRAGLDLDGLLEQDEPNQSPEIKGVSSAQSREDAAFVITQELLLSNVRDIDSPVLTAINLNVGSGVLVDNNDGTWTFTPDLNDNGSIIFTYDVTDGIAVTEGATLDLYVQPVNDLPLLDGQDNSFDENALEVGIKVDAESSNLLDLATDIEDDDASLQVGSINGNNSLVGTPVELTLSYTDADGVAQTQVVGFTLNADGSYSVQGLDLSKLPTGSEATTSFTYAAIDSEGAFSNTVTSTLIISGTNDNPALSVQRYEYSEDALEEGITLSSTESLLLSGATDIDDVDSSLTLGTVNGQAANIGSRVALPLVYLDADDTEHHIEASLTVNADGSYRIASLNLDSLPLGAVATASFTYQVADDQGALSNEETSFITITGTNDNPTLIASHNSYDENVFESGISVDAQTSNLLDGASDIDDVDSTLTIGAINEQANLVGTPFVSQLRYTDADGVTQVQHIEVVINADGSYQITGFDLDALPQDVVALTSFSYQTIDDSGALSEIQVSNFSITGTNDAPELIAGNNLFSEDHLENGLFVDADESNLLAGATDIDDADSSLRIGAINGMPFAVGQPIAISLGFTDPDGMPQVQVIALTVHVDGSYRVEGFDLDELPTGTFASTTFAYQAIDDDGVLSNSVVSELQFSGTNDNPVLVASDNTFSEDELEVGVIVSAEDSNLLSQASDIDDVDASLTVATINGESADVGTSITTTLSFIDASSIAQTQDIQLTVNANGSYSIAGFDLDALPAGVVATTSFDYQVQDDEGALSNTVTTSLTITGTNDAPVINDVFEMGTDEDRTVILRPDVMVDWFPISDVDSDELTLVEFRLPASETNATIVENDDGTYSLTANPNYNGLIALEYVVDDNDAATTVGQIEFTIDPVNDIPVLVASDNAFTEDELEVGVSVSAEDSNLLSQATDIEDDDSTLQVGAVNGEASNVGNAIIVTLAFTDVDGNDQTQDINLTINADGSYSIAGFDLDSLPDGTVATTSFDYQVQDDEGALSNTVTSALTINGTNDAPELIASNNTFSEDELENGINVDAASSNLLSGATDVDDVDASLVISRVNGQTANVGQAIVVSLAYIDKDNTAQTQDVNLTVNADGSYAIDGFDFDALPLGRQATATFTYKVIDDQGAFSSVETSTITITGTNDALLAVSDVNVEANVIAEDLAIGSEVGITANAIDLDNPDSDVTYSLVDDAGNPFNGPFSIDAATGVVTVAEALDAETALTHAFKILAESADGTSSLSDEQIVTVTDVDEFDVTQPIDVDNATNEVSEDAAVGTLTGVVGQAFDADITNNAVTYRLVEATDPPTVFVSDGSVDAQDDDAGTYSGTGSQTAETYITGILGDAAGVDSYNFTHNGGPLLINALTEKGSDNSNNNTDAVYNDLDGSGDQQELDIWIEVFDVATNTMIARNDDSGDARADDDGSLHRYDSFLSWTDGLVAGEYRLEISSYQGQTMGPYRITMTGDIEMEDNPFIVNRDETITIDDTMLLSNDSDVEGNVEIIDFGNAQHGTVTQEADGDFVFTPTVGYAGPASFTYIIRDADGNTDRARVLLQIEGENISGEEAVLVDDPVFVSEGTLETGGGAPADYTGPFTIDPVTGEVTVNGALNAEVAASHDFRIVATSEDGSENISEVITVNVNDVNNSDVTIATDIDDTANVVDENAADGTLVGITANAFDADATNNAVSYELLDAEGAELYTGPFAIDPVTGVVTVNGDLDAETAMSHEFTIRATSEDGSTSISAIQTVNINDVNEFDVTQPTDIDNSANEVSEDEAVGALTGVMGAAFDEDVTTNVVSYRLAEALDLRSSNIPDYTGPFTINQVTGVVTVNGALDAETATSHDFRIVATSEDGSENISEVITVNVNDVNEFDVTVATDLDATQNAVDENAADGTLVGITANAFDTDVTNSAVSYELMTMEGDAPYEGPFAIDPVTGVVTVNGDLDAETAISHAFTIRATSEDGSTSLSPVQTIDINDVNEFDVTQLVDIDDSINEISEDAAFGTEVGIIASAVDADVSATLSYSLVDEHGDPLTGPLQPFAINAETGVITVNDQRLIDAESGPTMDVWVRVDSDDGSFDLRQFSIAINDVDEFDVTAPFDTDSDPDFVLENPENGARVGITASANDDVTAVLTFSIVDVDGNALENPAFAIDSETGVVTVADNTQFDHESADTMRFYVRVDSDDGSSNIQEFTVAVGDVNEAPEVGDVNLGDAITVDDETVIGVNEDTSLTFTSSDLLANSSDIDEGDVLTVTAVSYSGSDGALVDQGSDTWVFTPNENFNGDVAFSFEVTDGEFTDTATASFTVVPVNDAPVAQETFFANMSEDDTINLDPVIMINFLPVKDVDGDELTITDIRLADGETNAILVQNDNGTYDLIPVENYNGDLAIEYTVDDGNGGTDVGEITLTVDPANDTPVLIASNNIFTEDELEAGIIMSAEDSNLLVQATDVEDDNSTLQIGAVNGQVSNVGSVIIATLAYTDSAGDAQTQDIDLTINADGSYSIDGFDLDGLPADSDATATFTYQVIDSDGALSAPQVSTVMVTGTNDAPEVSDAVVASTEEDTSIIVTQAELLAHTVDKDSTDLVAFNVQVTSGAGSVFDNADGSFTITPIDHSDEIILLSFDVSDGSNTVESNLNVVVTAVADSPNLVSRVFVDGDNVPTSATADFSSAISGVEFDISSDNPQTVGGAHLVEGEASAEYMASSAIGSNHDDVFSFSNLEAGDSFTIDGGAGDDALVLSKYSGDQVRYDSQAGTVIVDLDNDGDFDDTAENAVIHVSNVDRFQFRTDEFDGTPHGVIFEHDSTSEWEFNGTTFRSVSNDSSGDMKIAIVDFEGSMDPIFTLDAMVNAAPRRAGGEGGTWTNGYIIFDYVDANNYKVVGASLGMQRWSIGDVIGGTLTWRSLIPDETMGPNVDNEIQLRVDNDTVELWSNGIKTGDYTWSGQNLSDGEIGIGARHTDSTISIDMAPSNWASAPENIDQVIDVDNGAITIDLLENAVDAEGDTLVVTNISLVGEGNAGSVIDNGDGTITYTPNVTGIEAFEYTISDGSNESVGVIRLDVQDNWSVSIEEDETFNLDVNATLVDNDGSETQTVTLTGLITGLAITDGVNSFTAGVYATEIDVTDWDLDALRITPPLGHDTDFTFDVSSTATDSDGSTATVTQTMTVNVTPLGVPEVADTTATGTEDTVYKFSSNDFDVSDPDQVGGHIITIDAINDGGNGTYYIEPVAAGILDIINNDDGLGTEISGNLGSAVVQTNEGGREVLQFDSADHNEVVTLTNSIEVGVDWTIQVDFRDILLNTGGRSTLIDSGTDGDEQHISVRKSDNQLGVYGDEGTFYGSGYSVDALVDNQWYELTAVGSGGITTFYIDGVEVGSSNYQATQDIQFIGNRRSGSQPFAEAISDFKFFEEALSPTPTAGLPFGSETLEVGDTFAIEHADAIYFVGNQDANGALASFDYHATDFTGLASASATVTIDLASVEARANILVRDEITGSNADDVLSDGSGDASAIYGLEGDDILSGGVGDDLLVGGEGSDTLTGGEGADTFKFVTNDENTQLEFSSDSITDFEVGIDHIDLTEFLPQDSLNTGTSASDFIDVSEDADGNTILSIHTEGDGAAIDQKIEIEGVSVNDIYGGDTSGISEADILQKMIDDQNLLNGGM